MATLEKRVGKRGKVSWRVQIRRSGHPNLVKTFPRKDRAVAWAQQIEGAISKGEQLPSREAQRRTLSEAIDRYRTDVLPVKGDTRQTVQLAWWAEQLGDLKLVAVTPARIVEKRDLLARTPTKYGRPPASATIIRYLAALSHVFTVAIKEWQWIEINPVRRVSRPKEPRGRVRFLSDAERAALLEACRSASSPLLRPLVVLALATGARAGELLALRWPDVDMKRRRATLHNTKNSERRAIYLHGLAIDALRDLGKVRRIDTDLVFPGTRGRVYDYSRDFRAAVKAAGIENFRFHDLRHSAASYLAMSGASLTELAEILGHKTLAMVMRYSHLTESHTAAVVERMTGRFLQADE